jgi:hypothetical protein
MHIPKPMARQPIKEGKQAVNIWIIVTYAAEPLLIIFAFLFEPGNIHSITNAIKPAKRKY